MRTRRVVSKKKCMSRQGEWVYSSEHYDYMYLWVKDGVLFFESFGHEYNFKRRKLPSGRLSLHGEGESTIKGGSGLIIGTFFAGKPHGNVIIRPNNTRGNVHCTFNYGKFIRASKIVFKNHNRLSYDMANKIILRGNIFFEDGCVFMDGPGTVTSNGETKNVTFNRSLDTSGS